MHSCVFSHGLDAFRGGSSLRAARAKLDKIRRGMVLATSGETIGTIGVYVRGHVHYASAYDLWSEVDTRTGLRWRKLTGEWDEELRLRCCTTIEELRDRGWDHSEVILETQEIIAIWFQGEDMRETAEIIGRNRGLPVVKAMSCYDQEALLSAISKKGEEDEPLY